MNQVDNIIYLDNAATTKPDPKIMDLYLRISNDFFANPSSIHMEGSKAFHLLQETREKILSHFKLKDYEVIFTSGATESINLAIKGVAHQYKNRGKHIITSSIEHPAVLMCLRQLEEEGFSVTYLPVDSNGNIEIDALKSALREDTILVSIMAVNNEVGSVNNLKDISTLLKAYPKVFFHTDATQAVNKLDIDYNFVDLFSFTGHKIHGLKNCGILLKRKKIPLKPLQNGGGQENNYRSGTNDLASAVCLEKCLLLVNNNEHIESLFNTLYIYLKNNTDLYEINTPISTYKYILNFSLKTKKASVIVEGLSNQGIMVSSISACHSKYEKFSYVVKALGKSEQLASNTIRVSFDMSNTIDEIKTFINVLDKLVRGIRQ